MLWRATLVYFGIVFAAAFGLGVLRVLVVAPMTGALWAVLIEVPLLLALSWGVAGAVLRRWPLRGAGRLAMGAGAFALLMGAEVALATASGQSLAAFLAAMATPAGALGLAGQVGFGLLPVVRGQATG